MANAYLDPGNPFVALAAGIEPSVVGIVLLVVVGIVEPSVVGIVPSVVGIEPLAEEMG
jgi:hypothetical protein